MAPPGFEKSQGAVTDQTGWNDAIAFGGGIFRTALGSLGRQKTRSCRNAPVRFIHSRWIRQPEFLGCSACEDGETIFLFELRKLAFFTGQHLE